VLARLMQTKIPVFVAASPNALVTGGIDRHIERR
jgi:hypothetical protein